MPRTDPEDFAPGTLARVFSEEDQRIERFTRVGKFKGRLAAVSEEDVVDETLRGVRELEVDIMTPIGPTDGQEERDPVWKRLNDIGFFDWDPPSGAHGEVLSPPNKRLRNYNPR